MYSQLSPIPVLQRACSVQLRARESLLVILRDSAHGQTCHIPQWSWDQSFAKLGRWGSAQWSCACRQDPLGMPALISMKRMLRAGCH